MSEREKENENMVVKNISSLKYGHDDDHDYGGGQWWRATQIYFAQGESNMTKYTFEYLMCSSRFTPSIFSFCSLLLYYCHWFPRPNTVRPASQSVVPYGLMAAVG